MRSSPFHRLTLVAVLFFLAAFVVISLLSFFSCGGKEEPAVTGERTSLAEETATAEETLPTVSKAVLLVVAQDGFQDIEYSTVRQALEGAGFRVSVAAPQGGKATGMSGTLVDVDLTLAEARATNFAAVIFIGGSGTPALYGLADAHRLAMEAEGQGKVLAAICLAPAILARAGVLQGKKATVYSTASQDLVEGGATYTGAGVEIDGKIITADGPEASEQFARAVIEALR